jgi:hypothetical protein
MRLHRLLLFLSVSLLASARAAGAAPLPVTPDLVVAADGSGDFRSIHQAVQSIARENRERWIIFVRDGTYTEQVRVDAAFITLRGESRAGTRLEFSPAHSEQSPARGRAVLNLSATAHDFVLQNFTVVNTHGQPGVHAFAIYGRADRTVLLDLDVFGHTDSPLSLWGGSGRFYHARVNIRDPVDFNRRRAGSDFPWHRDVLEPAPAGPPPAPLTAAWTFAHRWDPERTDAPRILELRHQAQPDRLVATFSEAVTVQGRPTLDFPNGDRAELLAGSGTHVLEFSSPHAAFSGTAPRLELNGGAIFSTAAGNQIRLAALQLP